MKIFLYVPLLILFLGGYSKDSKASDKDGTVKDQEVKTEPIPDFPDPMTKEFIMAMWEAAHNVEGIIPEMEKIRVKEGVWKVEKEGGPNKDEMKKISSKESMSIKFVNRRFLVGKTRRENWVKDESLENDSFVRGDDLIYYWIYTYDYNKKIYRRWFLRPDIGEGFIGESSGQIIEDNLITENVNSPVGAPDGWKAKVSRKIIKDIKDKFSSQLETFVNGELDYYFEFSNKWVSELPKEGDFESNIAGKAISIEVKEGTKKNRMLFDFGEDRVLRLYEDGELVDESMSYRVDGLEVKFLAREQEDAKALDRLAMRMLFSSEDPKLGDEIIMKDRNNSFAGKILKIDELAKVLKENLLDQEVSYGRLKETFDGKYLYKGKPFTGKVHGGTGGGNRFEGNIVKGKWEGIWTERDKDGNKIQEDLYKDGELISSENFKGKSRPKINPKQLAEQISEKIKDKILNFKPIKNKLDKVIKTGEKVRVKSDLGTIQIALLNYKISAGSYPTTEQGLSALITKPADVRAWKGPYFKEGPINDPWGNEYGYRFPSQKGQDAPDIFSKGADGQENTEDDIGNWEFEEDNSKGVFEEGGLEEMLRSEGDREKLLRSNIVGKAFSLKSPDADRIGKFIFGEDGKISLNADGVIIPVGSYAVDGLKVKVFEGGRQNGGLEFYSLNPKVGDQVAMIDETNVKLSIVKIESANKVVADPKKQKTFANQAKRAEAMNEVTQLKNAISVYELEYAKLPFQARNAGDADLRMDTFKDNLISVLSGYNIDGLNPRKQAFYQGKRARGRDSQKPTSGVFGADEKLKLADPWGNAYSIVFDSNYDLTLKGLPGTEGKEVRASVAVWSTGGADDQKKFDPEKWIKSW